MEILNHSTITQIANKVTSVKKEVLAKAIKLADLQIPTKSKSRNLLRAKVVVMASPNFRSWNREVLKT